MKAVEALAVTFIRITLHDRHEKTPLPSNKPLEPENRTSRPKEKCMTLPKCLEALGKNFRNGYGNRTRHACPLGRGALPVRQTVAAALEPADAAASWCSCLCVAFDYPEFGARGRAATGACIISPSRSTGALAARGTGSSTVTLETRRPGPLIQRRLRWGHGAWRVVFRYGAPVSPQRFDAHELGGERAGSVTEAVLAALAAGTGLVLRTVDARDRTLLRVELHDSHAKSLYPVISRSETQM